MTSFFARCKDKIRKFFTPKIHLQTFDNTYNNNTTNVIYKRKHNMDRENIYTTDNTLVTEHKIDTSSEVLYFSTILNKSDIEFDISLFELKSRILDKNINIDNLILDDKFETELIRCCENDNRIQEKNHDIFKTKMRLFYVIIVNNLHNNIFHNKKIYNSVDTKYHLGVYQFDNYIIRIDDAHHSFESEMEVVGKLKCNEPNIILPFISYINVAEKKMVTNETEPADHLNCITPVNQERGCITYSQHLTQMFITGNISFSVQPYIKNTDSLLNWIGDNITDSIHSNLFELRNTFIINIFYKCACLIEILHLQNVVHGDIKPDNILFKELNHFKLNHSYKNKNFEIYLIDFGLSGIENVSVGTGGTTPYCHPDFRNIRDIRDTEKYRWGKIKQKHDVWSLGLAFITLYIFGKFNSYYYKFPPYFFDDKGYVTNLVIETISNKDIKSLFKDILTPDSISITEVKDRLNNIIIKSKLVQYN